MSYQDPTGAFPATADYHPRPPVEDQYIDDDDEEWVNQAPRGLRVAPVTGVLLLILFAVSGFWGGAIVQKHHDKSTKTAAAAALAGAGGGAARRAAAGLGAGTGAPGAPAGGRTLGTVSDVEGSTVYLTDASGNIVKINLAPTTKVTKTTSGTAADIMLGQSVVVTGIKAADGSTAAASITIVPPGAAAGAGTSAPGATGGG